MSKVLPWVMFTVILGLILSEIYVMKNKDRGAVSRYQDEVAY